MSEIQKIKYNQKMNQTKKSSRLNAKKQEKPEIVIEKDWEPITIDLSIVFQDRLQQAPRSIKNFKVYKNLNNQIVSSYFSDALKNLAIIKQQSTLSFFDYDKNIYLYGFTTGKEDKVKIRNIKTSLIKDNTLYVKIRNKKKLIVQALIDEQREKYEEAEDDKNNKQKQKKIGEVVQKVALWRKFYTGFYDELGNYIQKPLENAAQEVGIAKKTLDDYLLQIRNGKKYGFNFNEKVNAKIGQLRAFVRDEKKKQTGK